jgi:serine protein kinase
VSDEVRIYEKLLGDSALKGVHIAPHTLRVASTFAILTRLEPSKKAGLSLMKKLKLYDGDTVEGFTSKDLKELQDEAQREGMMGISPRYVINRLSSALVKEGSVCINPLDALRALKDGFEQHTGITKEERESYLNFIYEARKEFDELAKNEIQRAFIYSFEETARTVFNNYLDNVEAFCLLREIWLVPGKADGSKERAEETERLTVAVSSAPFLPDVFPGLIPS